MFQLRNPSNQAATTHAGVLEFIAEEGCVHLPYWMMKTLRLGEGDPIRISGVKLPKGKFIKIQPQQVHFLEVSDPKAVLEQALRNFTCLTAGDIIEISYNSMVLDFLIMDIQPAGAGINVVDTDIEVDFAAPKGYVEPPRPAPAPVETMATKLKIDVNSSTPGSSRPGSAMGAVPTMDGEFEVFKGSGQTLAGRKTKGKGTAVRKIAPVDPDSLIYRTDKPKMVTNDTLPDGRQVPAPLNLPFGKLFFGYTVIPYKGPESEGSGSPSASSSPPVAPTPSFGGPGQTLSGRPPRQSRAPVTQTSNATPSGSTKSDGAKWKGKGNTLSGGSRAKARSPSPEYIDVNSD
ncbi:ubiquitin fusion degradation protein [Tulasnella sp. 427]|nr:ubiquitin fusion degradation protein [Tulasnella sp. 427]